ncbi:hypothetical protein V6N13_024730 [Hibiscus sabdariffa]|uniref:Uncharacterized protein n=2 Tax=Hibiscus sabdariffa TaxID=183260 RepID=A0ABR2QG69_9ROSI
MSQRTNLHQRKASQIIFGSFDDIMIPISDNVTVKMPATFNQAPPPKLVRVPTPPPAAPTPTGPLTSVAKDNEKSKNAKA